MLSEDNALIESGYCFCFQSIIFVFRFVLSFSTKLGICSFTFVDLIQV